MVILFEQHLGVKEVETGGRLGSCGRLGVVGLETGCGWTLLGIAQELRAGWLKIGL